MTDEALPYPDKIRVVLKALMAKKKMSHAMVAELGSLHKSAVTRILGGERYISMEALQGFSRALGKRPSEILRAAEKVKG